MLSDDLLSLIALQLALLIRVDEAMNSAVVANALLFVVLAFSFSLGPGKAIELRMAFASWALFTRVVAVLLNEICVACLAINPLGVFG